MITGCKPVYPPTDCLENGNCPPEFYKIRLGEEKKYLWSLPGSYWIYKNTVSGDLDTLTCTSFLYDSVTVMGTGKYYKHITVNYDIIKRLIVSSYHKISYFDNTGEYNPNIYNSHEKYRMCLKRTDSSQLSIICFIYPFEIGSDFATDSARTTCQGIEKISVIQGKTYNMVAKFDIDTGYFHLDPNAIYYWAKDVGLIKRQNIIQNFSWELIEYNIIK